MLFSCPRCTGGAHLASQNQLFGSLAENGRFLNKPLIWKCYFPVPAALVVPIWRPKISYLGSLAEHGRQGKGRPEQGQGRARQGQGRAGQEGQRAVFPVRGRGGQGSHQTPRAGQGRATAAAPGGYPPRPPTQTKNTPTVVGLGSSL